MAVTRKSLLPIVALTVGGWMAFALLQTALSQSVATVRDDWRWVVGLYGGLALLWAAMSPVIAAWDRFIRARTHGAAARIALHVPAALLAAVADAATRRALLRAAGMASTLPFRATLLYYLDLIAVSYTVVVIVVEAIDRRRQLAERRRIAANLEAQLSRARLEFLDAQLQPHFLFNALGAISELAHEAPRTAARVLRQLAALLKSAFANERGRVTLGQELVTLEPYLEIQRIRFSDWLNIVHDIDDRAADYVVPRLMLQPLVENAVRHGVAGRVAAGTIAIQARVHNGRLIVRVWDNGVGLEARSAAAGRGIGLTNLRDRLAALYGDDASLRLYRDNDATVAELSLPAERTDTPTPAVTPALTPTPTLTPTPAAPREYSVVGVIALWAACGLLWSQQSLAYMALRHRPASVPTVLRSDLTTALLWAVLTLVIFAVAARVPVTAARWRTRIGGYVIGGIVAAATHVLVNRALSPSEPAPIVSPVYASLFAMDVLIYAVIVFIAHRRQLARWQYEREEAAGRLAAELMAARGAATRLRADPQRILDTLERLAELVVVDPRRTERGLARLADLLRLSLDAAGGDADAHAAALAALSHELESSPARGAGAA